ncbi:MAG: hypothetical protein U9N53_12950 [Bacteroidota bacterium]|nr:hypothetical protein [Bacteroidota bacterium]
MDKTGSGVSYYLQEESINGSHDLIDISGMSFVSHIAILYLDGKVISSGKFIVN